MQLLALLFTVFIDSMGFGLVFPILSPMIMNCEGGVLSPELSLATRGLLFGFLISSFCIGQFFGGPLLGAFSDRRGRKKILKITIVTAIFSYLLGGVGILNGSLAIIFISRILAGVAAGNFSIVQSIVADTSTESDKAKNFSFIGMAWGAGFIIGPFVGGKLANPALGFSYATPFWFSAFLCVLNFIVVSRAVKESLAIPTQIAKLSLWKGIQNIKKAYLMPAFRPLFFMMFLFSFGWGFFTEFSPLFLIQKFHFDVQDIANFYAYVGICVSVSQGILIHPFLKKFSSENLLATGLLLLGFMLPLMLLARTRFELFLLLPFVAFPEALIQPTAATVVSNQTPKEHQGEMLGIHNSIQWAAIGFAPLFSGSFVALYPHLPLTVASICMFLTFLVFIFFYKKRNVTTASQL